MSWKDRAEKVVEKPAQSWKERAEVVESKVIQEQHPEISAKERAILKNFANSPESGIAYLKQENPNLDIQFDQRTGQYRVKAQGEQDYKVVDPDTGFFSSDILSDAGDVAYDVYAMGSEGLATGLGAVGGAAVGGGIGALPAGAAAGGVASAGNEAMRQGLGQAFGIPQEIDGTDVAIAGGIGTASPLLFGAGKARGALKSTWDGTKKYVMPKLGEWASGVPSNTLRNYARPEIMDSVDNLAKGGNLNEYLDQTGKKITGFVSDRVNTAGDDLAKSIDELGRPIDISTAKAAIKSPADDLVSNPLASNLDHQKAGKLNKIYTNVFGQPTNPGAPPQMLPDDLPAQRAWQLQKDLKKYADYDGDLTVENVFSKKPARDAYTAINQSLDEASEGVVGKAKNQYTAAKKLERNLLPEFQGTNEVKSSKKVYDTLAGLDNNSKKVFSGYLDELGALDEGIDLAKEADTLNAYKYLGEASLNPLSTKGTTSTSRNLGLATVGGSLGSLAGYQMGGGYSGAATGGILGVGIGTALGNPAAMKAYIKANRALGNGRKFISPSNDTTRRGIRTGIWAEMLRNSNDVGEGENQ